MMNKPDPWEGYTTDDAARDEAECDDIRLHRITQREDSGEDY